MKALLHLLMLRLHFPPCTSSPCAYTSTMHLLTLRLHFPPCVSSPCAYTSHHAPPHPAPTLPTMHLSCCAYTSHHAPPHPAPTLPTMHLLTLRLHFPPCVSSPCAYTSHHTLGCGVFYSLLGIVLTFSVSVLPVLCPSREPIPSQHLGVEDAEHCTRLRRQHGRRVLRRTR